MTPDSLVPALTESIAIVRERDRLRRTLDALAPVLVRVARLEQALREAVEFYDKRLAEARRNQFYINADERVLPSPSEAERRERARTALQEADRAHPQPMNDKTKES